MDPEQIRRRLQRGEESFIGEHNCLRTAVLVPLVRTAENEWSVYFQQRSRDLETQPGDVCFPGGIMESGDSSPRETALRETREEMGIPVDTIELLGELPPLVMPWRLVVYPFVGILRDPGSFAPDPKEVERIFRIPLDQIRSSEPTIHHLPLRPDPQDDFPFDKIPGGREYDWRIARVPEPFYEVDGEIVWGITARILQCFVDTLKRSE